MKELLFILGGTAVLGLPLEAHMVNLQVRPHDAWDLRQNHVGVGVVGWMGGRGLGAGDGGFSEASPGSGTSIVDSTTRLIQQCRCGLEPVRPARTQAPRGHRCVLGAWYREDVR